MAVGDPIFNVAGSSSLTLNGVLSDAVTGQAAAVTLVGPGTLTLANANTYTGVTTIQSGTLAFSNTSALGALSDDPANCLLQGGTLYYTGADGTMTRGFTVAGDCNVQTDNTLTIAGAIAYTGGAFTKLGAGTLLFDTPTAGTNTLGAATVQTGTLAFDGDSASVYNVGTVNVGNATAAAMTVDNVTVASTVPLYVGSGTGSDGTLTQSSGAIQLGTTALRVGNSGGTGTFSQSGGSLTAFTASIGSGTSSVGSATLSGGNLYVAKSLEIGTAGGVGSFTQTGGTLTEGGDIIWVGIDGGTATYSNAGGTIETLHMIVGGTVRSGNTVGTYTQTGGSLNCSGIFEVAGIAAADSATGSATLSDGTISASQLIMGGQGTGHPCSGTLTQTGGTFTSGITALAYAGGTATYDLSGGVFNNTGALTIGAGGTDSTAAFNQSGGVANVTGGAITGAGTLSLSGGQLNMNGGTVGGVAFQFSGGTLSNASDVTTGVALTGTAGVISTDVGGTVSGTMSGDGFTKAGAGTLTLSAANTYTGVTTVKAGTLELANAAARTNVLANPQGIDIQAGLVVFDYADAGATIRRPRF